MIMMILPWPMGHQPTQEIRGREAQPDPLEFDGIVGADQHEAVAGLVTAGNGITGQI